jgi:hypothetical protein
LKVTIPIIERAITNEIIEEKIKQLKPIHPELAAVDGRIHEIDLETVTDALEALLKVHAHEGHEEKL